MGGGAHEHMTPPPVVRHVYSRASPPHAHAHAAAVTPGCHRPAGRTVLYGTWCLSVLRLLGQARCSVIMTFGIEELFTNTELFE